MKPKGKKPDSAPRVVQLHQKAKSRTAMSSFHASNTASAPPDIRRVLWTINSTTTWLFADSAHLFLPLSSGRERCHKHSEADCVGRHGGRGEVVLLTELWAIGASDRARSILIVSSHVQHAVAGRFSRGLSTFSPKVSTPSRKDQPSAAPREISYPTWTKERSCFVGTCSTKSARAASTFPTDPPRPPSFTG